MSNLLIYEFINEISFKIKQIFTYCLHNWSIWVYEIKINFPEHLNIIDSKTSN